MICTLLDPVYAANLYPWSKAAGFVNVVLHLITEEPTGKMLCVYKKKKENQDELRKSNVCVSSTNTIASKLWTYRIYCFHLTVTVCDLWTAPTVNVNEYLNCDRQKTE